MDKPIWILPTVAGMIFFLTFMIMGIEHLCGA